MTCRSGVGTKSLFRHSSFVSAEAELKPGFNSGNRARHSDARLREGTLNLLDSLLNLGLEER